MQDLFFIASKTLGLAARAETWLLALLALAFWALLRGQARRAAVWLGLGLGLFVLIGAYPLGFLLLADLESRYPAQPAVTQVDAIIVLGGDEDLDPYRRWGELAVNDAGERLIEGAILARRFPQAKLVFTGGAGSLGDRGDAGDPSAINRDGWLALGVDPARIVLERASRNTSENATMTLDLLQPKPGQVHLLVTSAFHMPRAMETFTRAGWTGLVAWPVDFRAGFMGWRPGWRLDKNLGDIDVALKEYVGLVVYRLAGK
jgi:uncharacterized SAM-binding protein YcdF (DUF218 family)